VRRVSKLHFGDIGKSFSIAFVAITIIWGLVSYFSLGGIHISWQILLGNLAVSGTLSAFYYRFRYHRVLEYDDQCFVLHTGSRIVEGDWKDFSLVSLYHKGYGVFALRIYRDSPDEKDFVELPASDLGLNPSAFRFEIAGSIFHHRVTTEKMSLRGTK
jgi:hypothetical protein